MGEKFSIYESVTVKKHTFKLFDACGLIRLFDRCIRIKRNFYSKIFKKKKRKLEKPSSMRDMPDSDSNGSEEGPFKGLNDAAMYVGEGPILVL